MKKNCQPRTGSNYYKEKSYNYSFRTINDKTGHEVKNDLKEIKKLT